MPRRSGRIEAELVADEARVKNHGCRVFFADCVEVKMIHLRPAEAEELRAVRSRKGHGLFHAVIGGAGSVRDPASRSAQRAGLFQRETRRVSRWPGNFHISAGAID